MNEMHWSEWIARRVLVALLLGVAAGLLGAVATAALVELGEQVKAQPPIAVEVW